MSKQESIFSLDVNDDGDLIASGITYGAFMNRVNSASMTPRSSFMIMLETNGSVKSAHQFFSHSVKKYYIR